MTHRFSYSGWRKEIKEVVYNSDLKNTKLFPSHCEEAYFKDPVHTLMIKIN
jgi:hypothetical protein